MSIPRYITAVLTVFSVLFARLYRSVDNLLTGAPVWQQAIARRQVKAEVKRSARHLSTRHVVTE